MSILLEIRHLEHFSQSLIDVILRALCFFSSLLIMKPEKYAFALDIMAFLLTSSTIKSDASYDGTDTDGTASFLVLT